MREYLIAPASARCASGDPKMPRLEPLCVSLQGVTRAKAGAHG